MRCPGIEPGSTAWKAAMLTTIPTSLDTNNMLGFENIFYFKSHYVDDPVQPKDDGKDEANVGTIVGIVIGVLLLLVAVTICVVFMYKQK